MLLGVNTTGIGGANQGYSYIQSTYWGGSENPLILNPIGGQVGIATTQGLSDYSLLAQSTIGVKAPANTGNTMMGKFVFAPSGTYAAKSSYIAGYYDKANWHQGAGMVFHTVSGADISGSEGVERMRITSDGNVGIGTASPTAKLHTKATSASDIVGIFQGTTSQTGNLYENRLVGGTSAVSGWDANGNLFIGSITPTSFADIAASTATRASLRLRSGTLPTVPNAGDISYDGAFKGWNGSSWLTFGGGGGGISIGDTITSASTNSVFFYNGGLAQAAGFTYTSGTSTLAAVNAVFTNIQATNPSNLTLKSYGGGAGLIVSLDGTYFNGVGAILTNTSFGFYALRVATGGADNNTAFGYYALASATGSASQYNSAFGTSALTSNTTGYSNNAFGRLALGLNTTGLNNVAMGHTALYSNTTGVGNVGVGLDANRKGTTANYNIAIGTSAMYGGTTPTGGSNVAIGYSALENYTTGQWNVAIGSTAGTGITTGSYNILIGTQGSTGIVTGSYNTIVGKVTGLSSSLSNTIILADGQGNKGFEWTTPRFTIHGDTLNINTAKTPASSGAAGTTGDVVWDSDFVYVCVASSTWKRAAIITF